MYQLFVFITEYTTKFANTTINWSWLRFWEVFMGALAGSLITFFAIIWKMKKDREEEFKRWFRKEYIEGALNPIIETLLGWAPLKYSVTDFLPEVKDIRLCEARKMNQLLNTKAFSIYFVFVMVLLQRVRAVIKEKGLKPSELRNYANFNFSESDISKDLEKIRKLLISSDMRSFEDLDKITSQFPKVAETIKHFEIKVKNTYDKLIKKFIEDKDFKVYFMDNLLSKDILQWLKEGLDEKFRKSD